MFLCGAAQIKMNVSHRCLAASFNNSIAGSAVQGLLDGESITSSQDVSGSIPGNLSNVLNDVPMDQDETQGLMHPEDFETLNRGEVSSAPPGIPIQKSCPEQVNDIIARYDEALWKAQGQNQNNVTMVKELSDSNEQLRSDIAELRHQMQNLIANTEKERSEHEKTMQDMQHNAEVRAKAMEAEHARALKEANAKLRSNLQQSHEYKSKRLVKHYEKEACDRERELSKCIDECTAELKRDQELMERKEASYQTKLEEMAKQINAIKADGTKKISPQPSARKTLGTLKKKAFEILPGTVNTKRGSAVPETGFSVNWDEKTLPPSNKHVHFGQCTSTPQHIPPIDLHDESEDIISGSSLNSSKPIPAKRSHRSIDCTYPEEVATTAITHVMASEFKN